MLEAILAFQVVQVCAMIGLALWFRKSMESSKKHVAKVLRAALAEVE